MTTNPLIPIAALLWLAGITIALVTDLSLSARHQPSTAQNCLTSTKSCQSLLRLPGGRLIALVGKQPAEHAALRISRPQSHAGAAARLLGDTRRD